MDHTSFVHRPEDQLALPTVAFPPSRREVNPTAPGYYEGTAIPARLHNGKSTTNGTERGARIAFPLTPNESSFGHVVANTPFSLDELDDEIRRATEDIERMETTLAMPNARRLPLDDEFRRDSLRGGTAVSSVVATATATVATATTSASTGYRYRLPLPALIC